MPTEYNIYTEDGTFITSISAEDIKTTSDTVMLGEFDKEGGFDARAVLPKNWAVIEAQ